MVADTVGGMAVRGVSTMVSAGGGRLAGVASAGGIAKRAGPEIVIPPVGVAVGAAANGGSVRDNVVKDAAGITPAAAENAQAFCIFLM